MIRVAFLSIHPSPYRDPFLNRLAEEPLIYLDVFEYERADSGHDFWNLSPPKYRHFLFRKFLQSVGGRGIHPGALKLLCRKYDYYVIPGTLYFSSLFLLVALPLIQRKVILYADSVSDASPSRLLNFIKHRIYGKASFVMVPGEAGVRFFNEVYGFPRSACLVGGYAMDVGGMRGQLQSLDQEAKDKALAHYGVPRNRKIFMMCANMLKRRDYPVLVEAFKRFSMDKDDVHLFMVGGGEDAPIVDKMIEGYPKLTRLDHCTYAELVQLYATIFCYVHAGCEPYSTAVTMGAIAGVPLISSPDVGASYDYIRAGYTGVLVDDRKNPDDWADACNVVYNWNDEKRQAVQDHLLDLARELSPEVTVSDFVEKLAQN